MLCLFRNSHFHPKLNPWIIALSWLAVFFWLEFAFIEKSLIDKIFAGHALIIDLLVGLPLVLAMAIMIYALVYWSIKVIFIFLIPSGIVYIDPEAQNTEQNKTIITQAEDEFGKEYWQQNESNPDVNKDSSNRDQR